MSHVRVGTRASRLAIEQTRQVTSLLERAGHTVEWVSMHTQGDRVLDRALNQIGDKGLFTAELEEALLDGRVDMAVHSLKDLPTELAPGLRIGAYTLPVDRRDVLLSEGISLPLLPSGAVIGTSSLRRAAFLKAVRPDIVVTPVRGNLETRVEKWRGQPMNGLILAAAGVVRLGWQELITQYLDPHRIVPAPGQGILAIEVASLRTDLDQILERLNERRARDVGIAERAVLHQLGGGCQVPLGAYAEWIDREHLHLVAQVASLDGQVVLREEADFRASEGWMLGSRLGDKLRGRGALQLIETAQG